MAPLPARLGTKHTHRHSLCLLDFWDTAGQESFNRMHPSYYYRAHCCILGKGIAMPATWRDTIGTDSLYVAVFDVTRKITYQHLTDWYSELR